MLVASVYPPWQSAIITKMHQKYEASTTQPKSLPEIRALGEEINSLPAVKASKFAKQAMLVAANVKVRGGAVRCGAVPPWCSAKSARWVVRWW